MEGAHLTPKTTSFLDIGELMCCCQGVNTIWSTSQCLKFLVSRDASLSRLEEALRPSWSKRRGSITDVREHVSRSVGRSTEVELD